MSKIYKKPPHCKGIDDHQKYLSRITKTLYYGKLPKTDMLSLPVTELAVEIFSEAQKGKSLNRLHLNTAAQISRNACVSPCSLVLAMLYFERLKKCNVDYLERTVPSDLFLVSLMVSSKFLFDDGEMDEVFMGEWAASSGMTSRELVLLERDFLKAIDWELYTNEYTFWMKLSDIEKQLAIREGRSRGYFTYTELQILIDVIGKDFHHLVQCVVAISVLLTAAYTAALLTLLGSVALASIIPGTSLHNSKLTGSSLLPITSDINIKKEIVHPLPLRNQTKFTTPATKYHNNMNLNALKVFKASLLLATIKSDVQTNSTELSTQSNTEECDDGCQNMSWDWWNIPVMTWLSKTSEYIKSFEIPTMHSYVYFLENAASNEKFVYLEDTIHKATKTRIQDQLERSWHVEWIDTIKQQLTYYNILSYLQSIKP